MADPSAGSSADVTGLSSAVALTPVTIGRDGDD